MFYTYVLLCSDIKLNKHKFYIGSTEDLKERIKCHKKGDIKTTNGYDKIVLIYYESCLNKADMRKREIKLKTGFGRGYLNKRLENYLKERA